VDAVLAAQVERSPRLVGQQGLEALALEDALERNQVRSPTPVTLAPNVAAFDRGISVR